MNRKEFCSVFPQTPEHFNRRMEDVLEEIGSMNRRKKKSVGKTVLIAAAILVLLTGSALAIGNAFGIFDFMKRSAVHIEPLEGAQELVENCLAYAEHDFGSAEVSEGIYSGRSCKVTVRVRMAEGYANFYPELRFLNAENPGAGTLDMIEEGDGTVCYMLERMLLEGTPELLECELVLPVYKDGAPQKSVKMMFSLARAEDEAAKLTPGGEGKRWKLLGGTLSRNEFSMVFDIEYSYTPEPGEDMGVDVKAFDAEGNRYPEGDTSFDTYTLDDGTLVYRQITEIQSAEEMPETIAFRPKVIGEDKWLDEIVCSVE